MPKKLAGIAMRIILVLAVGLFFHPQAVAQIETQLRAQRGPYHVGLPVTVQVTIVGAPANSDQPDVTVTKQVDDLSWSLKSVNPTSVQYRINNRVTEYKKYDVVFEFTAQKPGEFEIGPFEVKVGADSEEVESVRMKFVEIPVSDDMRIHLKIPEGPFFPGQRVPVDIQWWFAGSVRSEIEFIGSSPLFDMFRFEDEPAGNRTQYAIPIQTAKGSIDLAAVRTQESENGKTYEVFTARRTMIPDRVGTYEIDPIQLIVLVRPRNEFGGFFGVPRRRQEVQAYRAVGKPLTITIGGFPSEGRPSSFAGAVGKGFSIAVNANRTVVRVGDPIELDIRLRGDGNLIGASLPNLSAGGGLDPSKFRLPSDDFPGEMRKGEKSFVVNVRVEDESVQEIPSIEYSWYDSDAREYRTTYSDPIALRVMPAKVISATDVVSASPMGDVADVTEESADQRPSTPPALSLSGADLAIEPNPTMLLSSAGSRSGAVLQTGSYAAGIALVFLALIDRRRREIDPEVAKHRRHVRRQALAIKEAFAMPRQEAAEQIAGALRCLVADQPDTARSETQTLIGRFEAMIYEPGGDTDDPIDAALARQVTEITQEYVRECT